MQINYCNTCNRTMTEEPDTAYWHVRPANLADDYRPPRNEYRHVSLCSRACLLRWAQEHAVDPEGALDAAIP